MRQSLERRKNAVKPTESADAVMPITVVGAATTVICGTLTERYEVIRANTDIITIAAAAINERIGTILFMLILYNNGFVKSRV